MAAGAPVTPFLLLLPFCDDTDRVRIDRIRRFRHQHRAERAASRVDVSQAALILRLAHDVEVTRAPAQRLAVVTSAENTFEAVAREWFQKNLSKWKHHSRTTLLRFELYAFPAFGSQPIADVTSAQLLGLLRQLEARGVRETAHRVLQLCGQVFRYASATSRLTSDPTRALRGALTPASVKHFTAVIDPSSASALLRVLDGYRRRHRRRPERHGGRCSEAPH